MKIGIFDPYLNTMGGGEKYMLTIASCLSKANNVDIFWDNPTILSKAEERFGLKLKNVKIKKNIFSPNTSLLDRLAKTKSYDYLIYLSDGSLPLVLAKKLIIHFQFPVEWVESKGLMTKLKLSRVYKVICNSNFTRRLIDRKFSIKSLVLYPPADKIRSAQKENIILTIGRFGKLLEGRNFKKQDVMIKAFKAMVNKGLQGWKFVLVISFKQKDKGHVERLKKLTEGYPVEIVGNAGFTRAHELYGKAKIYWHATGYGEDIEKHPEFAEHFGISTVEAMSAGVVPVVINAGGQPEIVEDGIHGFLWNTLEELKKKTLLLIQNEKEREKIALSAQKRAEDFNKDTFCQKIYELVET